MAEPTAAKPAAKSAAKPKAAAKPKSTAKPRAAAAKKPAANGTGEAKAKFAKALEEAKAGAQALSKQAQATASDYRKKAAGQSEAWIDEAKAYGEQAKERAASLAKDGKTRASEALTGLGKAVSDSAGLIDEKFGAKYGDYARTAARSIQENAAKLDNKEFGELGDDVRDFVKKSPGLAVGIAAVAGFMFARLFKGSSDDE